MPLQLLAVLGGVEAPGALIDLDLLLVHLFLVIQEEPEKKHSF
jgi:hypothetical protein